jgi:DNA repair protein RadC
MKDIPVPFSVPPILRSRQVRETPPSGKLKSIPETLRPRELLLHRGCGAMPDDLLLAILLRSGVRGCNVVELARMLLHRYGSLKELADASPEELMALRLPGLSTVKAVELSAALEIARRVAANPPVKTAIREPAAVMEILRPLVMDAEKELFLALPLDRKNRIKGRPVEVSEGTVDASLVHPREVFRECVRVSAASVIVAHNHPSGDPTPSAEDLRVTRQLIAAGKVLGIPVLDHIILGSEAVMPPGYVSLRDKAYLDFSD